jgi:hypothetical protein
MENISCTRLLKGQMASREDIIGSRNVGEDGNASVVTRTMPFVGLVWLLGRTRRPWSCIRFLRPFGDFTRGFREDTS